MTAELLALRFATARRGGSWSSNHVSLVQNIERLKLDVDRILPLHGRIVPVAELYNGVRR